MESSRGTAIDGYKMVLYRNQPEGCLSDRDGISLWDALIVAAANRSGAERLYSEDLQNGRRMLGVTIVDPFR